MIIACGSKRAEPSWDEFGYRDVSRCPGSAAWKPPLDVARRVLRTFTYPQSATGPFPQLTDRECIRPLSDWLGLAALFGSGVLLHQRESTGSSVASVRAGRVTADWTLIISFTHRQ